MLKHVTALDVDITDNKGCTAVYNVISYDKRARLLDAALDGNATELCRLVYVLGNDVNVQDNNYYTPLHKACARSSVDIAGALLLAGANETLTNDRGETPAQMAAMEEAYENVDDVLQLLNVSSRFMTLLHSQRLRRRAAVRVMMTLLKWKAEQKWKWRRAIVISLLMMTLVTWKVEQRTVLDRPISNLYEDVEVSLHVDTKMKMMRRTWRRVMVC